MAKALISVVSAADTSGLAGNSDYITFKVQHFPGTLFRWFPDLWLMCWHNEKPELVNADEMRENQSRGSLQPHLTHPWLVLPLDRRYRCSHVHDAFTVTAGHRRCCSSLLPSACASHTPLKAHGGKKRGGGWCRQVNILGKRLLLPRAVIESTDLTPVDCHPWWDWRRRKVRQRVRESDGHYK